jgi:hypothetical protein
MYNFLLCIRNRICIFENFRYANASPDFGRQILNFLLSSKLSIKGKMYLAFIMHLFSKVQLLNNSNYKPIVGSAFFDNHGIEIELKCIGFRNLQVRD